MMDLEITEFNDGGYASLVSHDGWRVAIVNSCERLLEKNLIKMERHLKSNEVFILIDGQATLFTGEEMKRCNMEKGKVYDVKSCIWHCIALEENSKVIVVENDDVCETNSEYMFFERKSHV